MGLAPAESETVMSKNNTHLIEISCETSIPGFKTQTPVQLATEGDGSLGHWLASFRSVLVAAGFDASIANRLKLDRTSPPEEMETMRSVLEDKNG